MAADIESTLLGGHVTRDQRYRDVHVQQDPACQAVDVVVPIDTAVVPACLIRERQLLNETVLRKKVECPINRAVRDPGIPPAHALENLARGQVRIRSPDLLKDFRALRCVLESLSGHCTTHSYMRMSLINLYESYHARLILATFGA
jgi:hypothetical protein